MKYSNILLIDDDEDDFEIFLFAIQKVSGTRKYTIVNQAQKALDELEKRILSPYLIFLDLNMPVMNVVQFLKEIKKSEPLKNISVITLTTAAQPEIISHTKALGALDLIRKPSDIEDFVKIFESIL